MNVSGQKTIDRLAGHTVVIVGDLVADQFLNGTISRVSREAPVFILRHDETETRAGGAANAAANIASLGGRPRLVGLLGNDEAGRLLRSSLEASSVDCSGIISNDSLRTTTKVRVLAGQHYAARQQVIRIDYENSGDVDADLRDELMSNLLAAAEGADAIVVSDYSYGVVDDELFDAARKMASRRGIPLLIDSRFGLRRFSGATAATPNQDEVEHILGKDFTDADCSALRSELGFEALLMTCGNKGMRLYDNGASPLHIDAVGSREPVDVTGAGDTVIAAYALGLAAGLGHREAASIANHAGGIVVMKKGTATASAEELAASLDNFPAASGAAAETSI
ncbi:MAG: PfkB family carbohydrate kinase [Pyrinomonadaceae bacterium]|nr:PfkB family carbohydrate kinase [Pyrinomonadaceae bacterium]